MTARSIGEIATGRVHKARRTFQPVRRNSYNVGEREARFWRPFNKRERYARLAAAEAYNLQRKKPGQRNGPLGHVGLEILKLLTGLVREKDGRLEPSIEFMTKTLRRSRDAVVRAMRALKEHGFLEWIRRTEPTDNAGQAGPQVRQIPNAYRFGLPAAAEIIFRRILRKPPLPADQEQREAERRAGVAAMEATLTNSEFVDQTLDFADPETARRWAALGLLVDGRSANPADGQNSDRKG